MATSLVGRRGGSYYDRTTVIHCAARRATSAATQRSLSPCALRRGPGRGRGRSVLVVTSTAAVLPPFLGWRTMLTRRPRARTSNIATAIAVLGGQDLERLLPRPPRADQVRGARCGTSASPCIPDQWSRLRSLARHYNGLDRKINTTERPTEPATVSGPATATAAPPSTSRCRRAFVTLPVLPSVIVLIAPRFPPVASLRSPFALLCEVDHGHNPHGRLRTLRLAGHSPLDKVD